ncbi:MAG TPA: four helix bundle protein [Saprospiraceae bacterium]|nr:four helix bundle protein [Saprospiraceae bacterium]
MTWKRFEDIEAWQMARVLSIKIHELIQSTPINKHFALKDQMYGSSGSIMDNIAEGFERGSNGEFRSFLAYAKGSCGELRSQIYRCFDLKFIVEQDYITLKQECEFISGKIHRIIEYLISSDFKGPLGSFDSNKLLKCEAHHY